MGGGANGPPGRRPLQRAAERRRVRDAGAVRDEGVEYLSLSHGLRRASSLIRGSFWAGVRGCEVSLPQSRLRRAGSR